MPANDRGQISRPLLIVAGIGALVGIAYVASEVIPRVVELPEQQARCSNQSYTCTMYTPPGSAFAPDAGRPPYAPLILAGLKCLADDGGGVYRVLPTIDPELMVDTGFCVETSPDAGAGTFNVEPRSTPIGKDVFGCACKTGPLCFLKASDGGIALAPWGETLPYQGFTGTQCFGKVCGEIAGISSWPPECPTSRPLFDGGIPVFDGGLE